MHPQAPDSSSTSPHTHIHYGPIWDKRLEDATTLDSGPVGVLVCHGMGQQVRYETISSVAEAILKEAKEKGAEVSDVNVRLSEANDDVLARAEVSWDKDGEHHEVHVYEAYWAPMTEGQVTYWDTIKFLFAAGFSGLRHSRPFMRSTFKRWMFGSPKDVPIGPFAWISLLIVVIVMALQVAIIAGVSLVLANQWKSVIAQPLPNGDTSHLWVWIESWIRWLLPAIPGASSHACTSNPNGVCIDMSWWRLVGWVALVLEAWFVRYFLIQFVGDVAAYISPYKDSKFDELRHKIRNIGLNVGKVVYGFGQKKTSPQPKADEIVPNYSRIVVVGHSLGSVLAYDTLNALISFENLCPAADRRDVLRRTRALITFGSPLDKTAFIFRQMARTDAKWIREKIAAYVQPLIVSYDNRPDTFRWVNIWSPMDVISGSLEYYDDPAVKPTDDRHVQNMIDKAAWIPFAAHVQYWDNKLLREQLYKYVTRTPSRPQPPSGPKPRDSAAAHAGGA